MRLWLRRASGDMRKSKRLLSEAVNLSIHLDERVPRRNSCARETLVWRGFLSSTTMRKLVWIGLAVTAIGVLLRTEEKEDGADDIDDRGDEVRA